MKGVSLKLQNVAAKAAANTGGYMKLVRTTSASPSTTKKFGRAAKVIVRFETDPETGETQVVRVRKRS